MYVTLINFRDTSMSVYKYSKKLINVLRFIIYSITQNTNKSIDVTKILSKRIMFYLASVQTFNFYSFLQLVMTEVTNQDSI